MFFYVFLQIILFNIFKIINVFLKNRQIEEFIKLRSFFSHEQLFMEKERCKNILHSEKRIWIHVSSAGELEQAIHLIRKLQEAKCFILLSYFSSSTKDFLKNIPDNVVCFPFSLDIASIHKKIINEFSINILILVRYELWPSMIMTAKKLRVKLVLIGAVENMSRKRSGLVKKIKLLFRNYLYNKFDYIFVVSPKDLTYFASLKISAHLVLAGDPKWGRARERAFQSKNDLIITPKIKDFILNFINNKLIVLFGSPHKEELNIALDIMNNSYDSIYCIMVPHKMSEINMIISCINNLNKNIQIIKYSEIINNNIDNILNSVIIIDVIGILAELYAIADIAVVGGGFDGQIHNTLEAAAHPVPVIYGMNYEKAREANILVEAGAARSFANTDDMYLFINECAKFKNGKQKVEALVSMQRCSKELFAEIPSTNEVILNTLSIVKK